MTRPDSPLRILLVVDSLDGGGGERHVVGLARELDRRGHRVTLACATLGVLADALRGTGVTLSPLMPELVKRRFSPSYAERLRRLIFGGGGYGGGSGAGGYDVVHAHMYASATAAAAAVWRTGVPLLLTEHTEAPWRSPQARQLSRVTYRQSAGIVAVSSAIQNLLVSAYDVPPAKVRVCLPAVPSLPPTSGSGAGQLLNPTVAQPPESAAAEPGARIGYVGRLQPEKGVDVLLRALAGLLEHPRRPTLTVVGDGPCRADLLQLALRLGLSDTVRFVGYLDDPVPVLSRLDVLAVPSRTDGTPIVVLEGQGAGVPVVASATGGIPDRIQPGVDGLLVPPGDPAALAAALARLLDDAAMARRLQVGGRRRAAACRHEAMVDQLVEAYEGALLGGHAVLPGAPRGNVAMAPAAVKAAMAPAAGNAAMAPAAG